MGQGLKRRHLIDAMKAMDPTNSGEVTFDMFKNWLIDSKEGRHWSDFLVLPEGAVAALQRKAADEKLLPPAGDAAAEWKRLSVLLKLLSEATDIWGSPAELYGLAVTTDGSTSIQSPGKTKVLFSACVSTRCPCGAQQHYTMEFTVLTDMIICVGCCN